MKFAVILLTFWGPPVFAQDGPVYDPKVLSDCIAQAPLIVDEAACVGLGADACIETEAGSSTVGLGYCYQAELADWDARLNETYQLLLTQQAALHAELQDYRPGFPDPLAQMRQMQRAWIAYRDAACDWEALQWSGGTGTGPAVAECLMRLTADQAIFLKLRS